MRTHGSTLIRNTQGEKQCARCKQWKHTDNFGVDKVTADNHYVYCRSCSKEISLYRKYKLTIEQYNTILASQGGHCKICTGTSRLSVDHDHSCCPGPTSCGKCVRGILCNNCNSRIGWLENRKDKILNYLLW